MARKTRKARFKPFEGEHEGGRHLRITLNMMESEAWSKLSSFAIHVYLLLKIQYNGENKDNLTLTHKEGTQHMTDRRFTAALDELINYGFIYIVEYRFNTRESNIYGLSDMWKHYGTDKFKIYPRPKRSADSTQRLGKKNDTS